MIKRIVRSRPTFALAALALAILVIVALLAPVLAPFDPLAIDSRARLAGPSRAHLLGTDRYGRDQLSRLLFGARISLGVSVASVAIALVVGSAVGVVAGYRGGRTDAVVTRSMDVMFAFPPLLLAIMLAASLGPSARNAALAISVISIPVFARVSRAVTLVEVAKPYADAAVLIGARAPRIMMWHIVPNIATPLAVQATIAVAQALLLESGLSFLGLGPQAPAASWGSILGDGRVLLTLAPWITISAGAAITLTVLVLFVFGDGLRDVLDPRSRG